MVQKGVIESKLLSDIVIKGLVERKGLEITRMNLQNVQGAVTDYFILATGTSDKHVQAIANSVLDTVREDNKEKPVNVEGMVQGEWVLLDYVNVVVHVFQKEKREFFNLEELWGDGEIDVIEGP